MKPDFVYVYSDLLGRVRAALPPDVSVFLVGGSIRDMLASRPVHDLDFVLSGDVLRISRKVANRLDGAFYPLDDVHDAGRVILLQEDGSRLVMDFAAMRGADLESDLRARDFTINAMAVSVDAAQTLIDPLGGLADLRAGVLRACSDATFLDDPLRVMRAVRQAVAFNFKLAPGMNAQMGEAVSGLEKVSWERRRDELMRILDGPRPATALRLMDMTGILPYVLPELLETKGVYQTSPHVYDVFNHTLTVVKRLEQILNVLGKQHQQEAAANLAMGSLSLWIGRYRKQIQEHLQTALTPDRSLRPLLFLAALYHDSGKPESKHVNEDGSIHFYGHDQAGMQIAARRARILRLSNAEADRLKTIVRHHMRPLLLTTPEDSPTPRAVYRFFRDTGAAGVDICLLSLADALGTYGSDLDQDDWGRLLEVVRTLLDAWWEQPEEKVSPPALVNGTDLIEYFDLEPGPEIGRLLEEVREAQVMGEVESRAEALEWVEKRLDQDR